VLFDIDGTVVVNGKLLDGFSETVSALSRAGVEIFYVTNSTTRSAEQIGEFLKLAGVFPAGAQVITPIRASIEYYKNQNLRVWPMVASKTKELYSEVQAGTPEEADAVLVGDPGTELAASALGHCLEALMNGARLHALHVNRFWVAPEGVRPDAGAFVRALEYAGSQECSRVFGKPGRAFFESILGMLGTDPGKHVWMVGDDLESDVSGAIHAGLAGVLVKTGKYEKASWKQKAQSQSDVVIEDANAVQSLLASV
jgi:HAD superfamily hydrolase (TIGR01458 family)